jgi:hypothetical protein
MSIALGACFGPCTTFDGEAPRAAVEAGAADAEAGTVDPRAYLSLPDAVRVCSLVSRCPTLPYSIIISVGVPVFYEEFTACVDFLSTPIPPSRRGFELQRSVFRAIAEAEDGGTRNCNVALSLMPVELIAEPRTDPRCTPVGQGCSSSTTVIACGDSGVGTLTRCAPSRGGPSCVVPEGGALGECVEGECAGGGLPDTHCEGTVYTACDPRYSKTKSAFDCAWLGLTCGTRDFDAGRYPTCITDTSGDRPCNAFGQTRCNNDVVELCMAGAEYHLTTFDCGELALGCGGGGLQAPAYCIPTDAECVPTEKDMGSCDGSKVTLCLRGRRTQFDCASVGLQCDSTAKACL